jgi:hypothetical protein
MITHFLTCYWAEVLRKKKLVQQNQSLNPTYREHYIASLWILYKKRNSVFTYFQISQLKIKLFLYLNRYENDRKLIYNFCYRSVKCRFTALGLLLGLTLSLGAIIPIVIIWQKSVSGNEKNIIINSFIIFICIIVSASNPTSSSV